MVLSELSVRRTARDPQQGTGTAETLMTSDAGPLEAFRLTHKIPRLPKLITIASASKLLLRRANSEKRAGRLMYHSSVYPNTATPYWSHPV